MKQTVSLCALAGVLISGGAGAQSSAALAAKGIPGYLDPRTHLFTMMAEGHMPRAAVNPDSTATVNAIVKVTDTITVVSSSLTTNATFSCSVTAELVPLDGGESYFEEATGPGTRSGNTVTCTVLVPFGWKLINPSSDLVEVLFEVDGIDTTKSFSRTESTSLGEIAVPAAGTTTTLTLTSRL